LVGDEMEAEMVLEATEKQDDHVSPHTSILESTTCGIRRGGSLVWSIYRAQQG
jgi:hypothetical protein